MFVKGGLQSCRFGICAIKVTIIFVKEAFCARVENNKPAQAMI